MNQLRKRLGHHNVTYEELEDELEYNFGRKEDLKEEVKNLEEKNKELQRNNWKNVLTHIDIDKENIDLKERIELLEKENSQLKMENRVMVSEDTKSEINNLKDMINNIEKDADVDINDLKTENLNLQLQIKDLLKCGDCDLSFDDKTLLKKHILSSHLQKKTVDFKCNECDLNLDTRGNLKAHIAKEHTVKRCIQDILRKEESILVQISEQKIKLYDSLYILKQKEERQKLYCSCRGRFCRIAHSKYRWIPSQSDILLIKLKSTNQQSSEPGTNLKYYEHEEESNIEDIFKRHSNSKHESDQVFQCHDCERRFDRDEDLQCHRKTDHLLNIDETYKCHICESEFIGAEIFKLHHDTFHPTNLDIQCQQCEKTFRNKDSLLNHMEEHQESGVLENTFFNPSAHH